jgi:hypothetical protein
VERGTRSLYERALPERIRNFRTFVASCVRVQAADRN